MIEPEPIQPTTASIWKLKCSIVCVNPSNPDDKMEFDDVEQLNAKLFELKKECDFFKREALSLREQVPSLLWNKDRLESENEKLKHDASKSKLINTQLLVLSNQQFSYIRKLTSAGDAMANVITEYRCSPWGNKVKNAFVVWNNWHNSKTESYK
jgi:hypothetical protein